MVRMPVAFRRPVRLFKTTKSAVRRKTTVARPAYVKKTVTVKKPMVERKYGPPQQDPMRGRDREERRYGRRRYGRRRVRFGRRKFLRKGYNGRKPDIMLARPFSMVRAISSSIGGRVVRTYQLPLNVQNQGASSTSAAFGLSVLNVAGTLTLNAYAGRAISGTGTSLGSFTNFSTEAGHLCDTFKWMTVKRIQLRAIPVTHLMVEQSTSISDTSVQADAGVFMVSRWNGDDSTASATTGASLADEDYHFRTPHKSINPTGQRETVVSVIPTQVEQTDNQFGGEETYEHKMRPLETSVLLAGGAEYPFYGLQYFWYHPNLASNAAKHLMRLIIEVEVQWNTVWDVSLQALANDKKNKRDATIEALKGQPSATQPAGHSMSDPVVFYSSGTDDKKEYEMPELKRQEQQVSIPNSKPIVKGQSLPPSRPPTPTKSK